MSDALLEATALSIERGGRQLLNDFSLRVDAGEIVHLQGANGAGKTSLLRVLAGLSVHGYEGRVTRRETPLYIGHLSGVKAVLSVRENLCWHTAGESYDDPEAVNTALAQLGLYGFEDVPAVQLSAGQQRRVNLARLFLSKHQLWLLDEPFTAIDIQGVERLQERMRAHIDGGGAILLTSHQALSLAADVRVVQLSGAGEAL